MNIFYFYFLLLLLGFILLYRGISFIFYFAPVKIKLITIFAFILLGLRYITLILFLLCNSIKYLYLFKPLVFLNFLAIPVLALVSIYILARKDKLKFNYCITASFILLALYIIVLMKLPVEVDLYKNLGYRVIFAGSNVTDYAYLIINTVLFFISLLLGDNNIKKTGMWLISLSAFVTMLEIVLKLLGVTIIPVLLFGDLIWIITADYALNRLKK